MAGWTEGFFEAFFQRQGDAVIVADDEALIVRVNDAACAMLGRTRADLEGKPVAQVVVEDAPDATQRLWDSFQGDSQQRGRIFLRRGDGTVVVADYVATANIGPGLHVSVLRDDTERRRAEQVLRLLTETTAAMEATLDPVEIVGRVVRTVVDLVADWAAGDLLTPDGTLERVAIAHSDRELEQRAWELWGLRTQATTPAAARALETGTVQEYELSEELLTAMYAEPERRELVRALGIRRALLVPIPSLRTERLHGLLSLVQAESNRPLSVLRNAAEEVGRRVGAALDKAQAYEEVRESRRAAEEANRLKDEFLGTVSHELRTPLNAVFGWTQLLRSDGVSSSELDHGLAVIERNATAQKQLIDDLLDVSRIVSGSIRLDLGPVALDVLLEDALASVEPAASEREIDVECEVEDALPPVTGDASRLQQVVWNLLSNAIKFSTRGGSVRVTLEREGDHLRLTVTDDGSGIDPQVLPTVFDRFRQAEGGSTRRHGGLGLGLAIVDELVRLHGGTVEAHSEGSGRGSTFVVRLPPRPPARSKRPSQPDEAQTSLAPPPPRLTSLAGLRVLLVEDDPDSRALMARMLARAGAHVSEAGSAAAALALLTEAPPDVLISDIGMPEMDGYELIRRVRGMDLARQPPAIAVTAYASARDRAEALGAGYGVHMPKPVNAAKLTEVVAELARGGS